MADKEMGRCLGVRLKQEDSILELVKDILQHGHKKII